MFEPIIAALGLILGAFVATHPGELPTCEEVQLSSPAVYAMQNAETTGARPLKICR